MNARQARQIRFGIGYARDVQILFAVFGPTAMAETFEQFTPKNKLIRRAYLRTGPGKERRRAERLVRGKSHRQYMRRHGLDV